MSTGVSNAQMRRIFSSHYGVELNLPRGKSPKSAPKTGPAAAASAVKRRTPPRAAQSELGCLMRNISRETYSAAGVDNLLKKGWWSGLSRSDRADLQTLSDRAADALAKIKDVTVNDILDEKDSSVATLFETAADLQLQLANKLRELAESPGYRMWRSGAFRQMLSDLSLKCDSRGSEILTLYQEVKELGGKLKAQPRGKRRIGKVGSSNDELSEAKAGDLIMGMSALMHGNDKSRRFGDAIKSIETRLARLSKSTVVKPDDLNRLLDETKQLSAELKKPEVVQTMDADISAALTSHLDTLRDRLTKSVDRAVTKAKRALFYKEGNKKDLTERELTVANRIAGELDTRRWSWKGAKANKLAGEDVINAFRRNNKLSMVLEARVHGANERDINPRLCDKNLVKKKPLKSGGYSTVYQMTYRMADGSTKDYVFKPDQGGRTGLERVLLGESAYSDTQQVVKLNSATCDVAELLGLGRLTGRNYATVHEKEYGLLMEMAPGCEASAVARDESGANRRRFSSPSVVGRLARELNDLRWLDIATGQGDRHRRNYMVDFGQDGRTPKVTAIDNDVCLLPYLVGVGKCKVDHDPDRLESFESKLKKFCRETGDDYAVIMDRIRKNDYVIDVKKATKAEICALYLTFGFHSLVQPRQMSRSLCDRLRKLDDKQIVALAKKLAEKVDSQESVHATVCRLVELRKIAIAYSKNRGGRVVDDDKWGEVGVLKRELERPSLLKNGYDEDSAVDDAVSTLMSTLLLRDFGSLVPAKWTK